VPAGYAAERNWSGLAGVRSLVLGLSPRAADLTTHGFPLPSPAARPAFEELQRHARAFVDGYNGVLAASGPDDLARRLAEAPPGRAGFWTEGAAMGAAVLDTLSVPPRRMTALRTGAFRPHRYLVHVGVGWAWARLHIRRPDTRRVLDPLLSWLAWDGLGFARGFFAPERYLLRQRPPWPGGAYAGRVADQGLGRCLWFYGAAQPVEVVRLVAAFAPERRPDLWSGVGLAATYAGGVPPHTLGPLIDAAGASRPELAQGAVFGATARVAAGESGPETAEFCRTLSGLSPSDAVVAADEARHGCSGGTADDYERWRRRIRELTALAGRA
jgi:hypothetical protein